MCVCVCGVILIPSLKGSYYPILQSLDFGGVLEHMLGGSKIALFILQN